MNERECKCECEIRQLLDSACTVVSIFVLAVMLLLIFI